MPRKNFKSKRKLVDLITDNPVYTPDSGVVVSLRIALLRLSYNDLHSLHYVIGRKCQEAANQAVALWRKNNAGP